MKRASDASQSAGSGDAYSDDAKYDEDAQQASAADGNYATDVDRAREAAGISDDFGTSMLNESDNSDPTGDEAKDETPDTAAVADGEAIIRRTERRSEVLEGLSPVDSNSDAAKGDEDRQAPVAEPGVLDNQVVPEAIRTGVGAIPGGGPVLEAAYRLGAKRTHPDNVTEHDISKTKAWIQKAIEKLPGDTPPEQAYQWLASQIPEKIALTGKHPIEQAAHLGADVALPGYEQQRTWDHTSLGEKGIIAGADALTVVPGVGKPVGKVAGKLFGPGTKAAKEAVENIANSSWFRNLAETAIKEKRLNDLYTSGRLSDKSVDAAQVVKDTELTAKWDALGEAHIPYLALSGLPPNRTTSAPHSRRNIPAVVTRGPPAPNGRRSAVGQYLA